MVVIVSFVWFLNFNNLYVYILYVCVYMCIQFGSLVSQCTCITITSLSFSFNRFHFKTLASIGLLAEEALVKCMGVEKMTLEKCQCIIPVYTIYVLVSAV